MNFCPARLKNSWGNILIHLSQFVSSIGIIGLKANIEAYAVEPRTIWVLLKDSGNFRVQAINSKVFLFAPTLDVKC
jgi:hypothetical protein